MYGKIEKDSRYADNIIENMYIDEIKSFFDCLKRKEILKHTIEEDIQLLVIIDKIEG